MRLKIINTIILYLFFTSGMCMAQGEKKTILFFGDSITAGYGLEVDQAFPALIQSRIDSLGYPYKVVNAGLSGETSAGGLRRIDWITRQKIDIFVLELGGNDGLRGIDPESTRENLIKIIKQIRAKYPNVKILFTGMQAPPNMGIVYTEHFKNIFYTVADSLDLHFYPFILEDVAGHEELNQSDGIHPTAEGHRIIADNLWPELKSIMKK